jgi:ATP-dependent DNA ligase
MLPILYKKDAKDAVREWEISVSGSTITVLHGTKDGVKTKTTEQIIVGKNIGKKNETTKEEQANLEAKSKWTKKRDSGYYETLGNEQSYKPMLANEYKKHKQKVKYPVYVQPKLDGYRMIYNGPKDKILSRTGKEFDILYGTPLHKDLQKYSNLVLDGELYLHNGSFQDLGIIRKKKNDDKFLLDIEYHVYDTMTDKLFSERLLDLKKNVKPTNNLKIVSTILCKDEKCVDDLHLDFIKKKYEGTMVRQNTKYIHNRTSNLLKYKDFEDAEFKVVDFTHEKDTKGDGLTSVVWICITKDGIKFNVPSKGTREERDDLYKNGEKYIGKSLTVQFFGKSEEGVPRFPKTLRSGKSSFK